ncbi:phospholipase D-like domain-containing protein [Alkalicoccobacillus gibsonii]|uniref:phospholipase D-like domain-containing protein n=1 Tax=Alkalicoccobacillus gibsonii TaxID=79881 RepID=UPI001AEE3C6C|nr:phospholipase D family protein [Alkalicoccobacillus gibsonii]
MAILIKNILLTIITLYAIYVLLGAYILFFLPISYHKTSDKAPLLLSEDVQNKDHVLLLEDGFESGQVRMQAIKEAQSSIDFISYSVQKGKTSHLFMAELFEAADRGVHVRVLLDGLFHNLRGDLGDVREAIAAHPNMELRYYEPFKLLKPWSWHNRLHDKLLIIDETYGIIGGRNIGDKYLSKKRPKDYVFDRDVLVYNKNKQNSSLLEMKEYANELWEHPFTKQEKHAKDTNSAKGKDFQEKLKGELQLARDENDAFVRPLSQDWMNQAIQADHISFVSNPLTRLNKYPYLWKTFTELATNAESKVYMQTPYAIPTNQMIKHVEMQSHVQHDMMTNSIQQTPNPMAFSGYLGTRDEILNSGVSIYEYRGNYSIHAKSFVIDDYLSMVGSFNLDARSSYLNTESAVLIQGSEFASELTKKMDEKKERSVKQPRETTLKEGKRTFKTVAIKVLSEVSFLWRIFL